MQIIRALVVVSVLVGACAACNGNGGSPDSRVVDIDNGSCGDQLRFTGEYVDWDFDVSSCGIGEATIEVSGDGAMDTTAPNGRFDLCIPSNVASVLLTVAQPPGTSQCASPTSSHTVPTILLANKEVIQAGGFFSGRAFTAARQTTFFQAVGAAFDATKAHVFVHVNGTPRAVSLAAPHGPAQAIVATAWAAGDTGHDVFFPNVDVGGGETMLTVAGGAIGAGSIRLQAGTITNVAVIAN